MPQKFLNTKVIYKNNQIKAKADRNERKLSVHWTLKIPKRYKENTINAALNRAARVLLLRRNRQLKKDFLNADYP